MSAALKPGTITDGFATESTHWYKPDGAACYEIVGANGKQRPVTLRDAKKLGLFPSVTGIIKCAAAPGLEHWKRQQVLLAAMTLPRIDGETIDEFARRIAKDSEQQAKDARDRGTAIHGEIERAFKGEYVSEFAAPVVNLLSGYGKVAWSPERSFASHLGYGGKTDLHAYGIVVDFKTKDFGPDDEIKGYDEHLMQLVACAVGLGEDLGNVTLLNLFVSTRQPGLIREVLWPDIAERMRAWEMFKSLLAYWKAQKRVA